MSEATNRIEKHFQNARQENRKSLIMFLTAGFPEMKTTEELIHVLDKAGTDVLELGVPFSDPIADGPTIQAASAIALKAGASLAKILDLVETVRKKSQIPILLFGAYNPFLHYGLENLVDRALQAGVDGFLVPDLPMEESEEFDTLCRKAGLALVYLAAPGTPDERAKQIINLSRGFLYFISLKGVTGTSIAIDQKLREKVKSLRNLADPLPVAVGFGIQTPEHAAQVAQIADAVVVGSALIRVVDENREKPDLNERVGDYVRSLKKAIE
ncbi:tryptophan synthase subunit alpha [bacterium]|nr:tryptophan synthase subunit alpha [bacterium]